MAHVYVRLCTFNAFSSLACAQALVTPAVYARKHWVVASFGQWQRRPAINARPVTAAVRTMRLSGRRQRRFGCAGGAASAVVLCSARCAGPGSSWLLSAVGAITAAAATELASVTITSAQLTTASSAQRTCRLLGGAMGGACGDGLLMVAARAGGSRRLPGQGPRGDGEFPAPWTRANEALIGVVRGRGPPFGPPTVAAGCNCPGRLLPLLRGVPLPPAAKRYT